MGLRLRLNLARAVLLYTFIESFSVEGTIFVDSAAEPRQAMTRRDWPQETYPSKRVLDFLSIYNGDYNNGLQIYQEKEGRKFIQGRVIPVDVRCFQPNPGLYLEKIANNQVRRAYLAVVTENFDQSIFLTMYNITNSPIGRNPGGKLKSEHLNNIPCSFFEKVEACDASFRLIGNDLASGEFSECHSSIGDQPRFPAVIGCDYVAAVAYPSVGYYIQRIGQKYPVINAPPDYVSPCH